MTISVMADLETLGTEPGCDIRSIGACVFSLETGLVHDGSLGTIKPFYIACDNPATMVTTNDGRRYPLHRDPRTVQWWSEQSDEAQAAFADPVDLREALERFSDWIGDLTDGEPTALRLWSHGAHFDGPILAAAYKAVGLPVPWHYRAPRDTRTAFDMVGIDDHSAWLAQFSGDDRVQHHALSDAICQARAVCGAWAVTRRWYLTSHEGFESELNNIVRDIQDEDDRAYFGSTNDADLLRDIAEAKDANQFERDLSDSEGY